MIYRMGERAIHNKLDKYFMEKYGQYERTIKWHPNKEKNIWKGDIKELGITITLECLVTGTVVETTEKLSY